MKRNLISKTLVGSVLLASLALAGCGGSTPASVDDPSLSDPSLGNQYGAGTDPSAGYGSTPTTGSTYGNQTSFGGGSTFGTGAATGGELSATVIKTKNGSFMGLGKFVATVEVNNPSQQSMSGTLTVTFTNKSKPTAHVETKKITVAPGETQTLTFEDKKWSTDGATAEITTDPSAAAPAAQTGSAYGGATGSYGAPAGGSYGGTTY
jgi:hypothetical protein